MTSGRAAAATSQKEFRNTTSGEVPPAVVEHDAACKASALCGKLPQDRKQLSMYLCLAPGLSESDSDTSRSLPSLPASEGNLSEDASSLVRGVSAPVESESTSRCCGLARRCSRGGRRRSSVSRLRSLLCTCMAHHCAEPKAGRSCADAAASAKACR